MDRLPSPFWRHSVQAEVQGTLPALAEDILSALQAPSQQVPLQHLAVLLLAQDVLVPTAYLDQVIEAAMQDRLRPALVALWERLRLSYVPMVWQRWFVRFPPPTALVGFHVPTAVNARVGLLLGTTRQALRPILQRARTRRRGQPLRLSFFQQLQEIVAQLGLTESQAQTVATYRAGLEETDIAPAQIVQRLWRKAVTLRAVRANAIAATEVMMATNMLIHHAVVAAVQEGVLEASSIRRHWQLASRETPCHQCAAIAQESPQGVGLAERFETAGGALLTPPLHPGCQCLVRYEIPTRGVAATVPSGLT